MEILEFDKEKAKELLKKYMELKNLIFIPGTSRLPSEENLNSLMDFISGRPNKSIYMSGLAAAVEELLGYTDEDGDTHTIT